MDNNLLEFSNSECEKKFVRRGCEINYEVAADILNNVDNIPYLSSIYKLGKLFIGFHEVRFMNQLASFLAKSHEIPKDKKDRFLNELSDKKKKQISDYLIQLLYNIEDQRKSSILGYIYKYRLLEELSKDKNPSVQNDIMLRMCHAINNVYTDNLLHLKKYESYIEDKDIITDDLFHVGLLEQSFKQTNQLPNIPTAQYRLNPIGKKLMEILDIEKWFDLQ